MPTKLFYVHDPMCSWCWGFRPTLQRLIEQLPKTLEVEYLLGGLAADTHHPMPKAQQQAIIQHWKRIEQTLGSHFNYDFWHLCKPRRSTYPACRSVIAAKKQTKEMDMIQAIQEAYYVKAQNPSDYDTHYQLAQALGLNLERFKKDIMSSETEQSLQQQIQLSRSLPISGFPSLVLWHNSKWHPIKVDYLDHNTMLGLIETIKSQQV